MVDTLYKAIVSSANCDCYYICQSVKLSVDLPSQFLQCLIQYDNCRKRHFEIDGYIKSRHIECFELSELKQIGKLSLELSTSER